MSESKRPDRKADYGTMVAAIEERAEERAPGVLEMVDAYRYAVRPAAAWRPVNASVVTFSTTTSDNERSVQ